MTLTPNMHKRFLAAAVKQPQQPLEWNVLFYMEVNARTVVSQQRFSQHNMLHFLHGAVATKRLVVAMEHERTYLLARTSAKTTPRPPVCRSNKSSNHGSRLQDFWQWEFNNWGGEKAGTVQLIDWLIDQHLGSSPIGTNAPTPYKRALCAP